MPSTLFVHTISGLPASIPVQHSPQAPSTQHWAPSRLHTLHPHTLWVPGVHNCLPHNHRLPPQFFYTVSGFPPHFNTESGFPASTFFFHTASGLPPHSSFSHSLGPLHTLFQKSLGSLHTLLNQPLGSLHTRLPHSLFFKSVCAPIQSLT